MKKIKIVFSFLLIASFLTATSCVEKSKYADVEKLEVAVNNLELPVGESSSLPYLIKGDNDQLYLSWVERADSTLFYYSKLSNSSWSKPELIASGGDWFVNWADYPMIAIDKRGNMIAHYLAKSAPETFAYDVNVMRKASNGSWEGPLIPHTDSTQTEHGFVSMLPDNEGYFRLAWLDGRNTSGGHGGGGAMTLRTARMDLAGNLSEETELDGRICDCCQTSGTSVNGIPYFVYRDRSENEIRDIGISGPSGNTLVHSDNWKIAGCPVNGPSIASHGKSLSVAWFTAAEIPTVKLAFATADQSGFDTPIIIDNSQPVGRVDLQMVDENTAVVSWLDSGDKNQIKCKVINREGIQSEEFIVAETTTSRSSGFPQMEYFGDKLYFAWTSTEEKVIKMAVLELF